MEFRFTHTIAVLVLSFYFVHIGVAMPRTAERRNEVIEWDPSASVAAVQLEKTTTQPPVSGSQFPGRVTCQYEGPTEHSGCQEHCIPKGYKYGLCTNYVCSCI